MTGDRAPAGTRIALATALFAVVAVTLVSIGTVEYLPTHDGPQHIFTIHAANHLGDPGAGYDGWLTLGHPVTNLGFRAIFGPLDLVLEWKLAYQIALCAMVLLWIGGCVALASALHPARIVLGIALAGVAFRWSLYMGLFSFYVATSFGLWILAFALSCRDWTPRRRALLAGLLFVQALFHIFPALLSAGLVSLMLLVRAPSEQRARELGLAVLTCLPVMGLLAALLGVAAQQAAYHDPTAAPFEYRWPGLWLLAGCFSGGPGWRAWTWVALAATAPLLALRFGARSVSVEDRVLLGVGVGALVASIALPLHVPIWEFFSVRLLPLGFTCLVLAIPIEALRSAGQQRALAAGLSIFAIASAGWAFAYNLELEARTREALAGLDAGLQRSGARLPIVLDPFVGKPLDDREAAIPFAVPLLNLGQIYATEQGGVPADSFAISPPTHHVLMRKDAGPFPAHPPRHYPFALAKSGPDEDPQLRPRITTYVASFGAQFEDVIVWGEPRDADLLLARGYVADWRKDGLMLAHFEGCPLSIELSAEHPGASLPGDASIELGWYPLLETAGRFELEPEALQALGSGPRDRAQPHEAAMMTLELASAPCGPAWIRWTSSAASPRPTSPPPAVPALQCRGAAPDGRVIVADTRHTPQVRCELVDRATPSKTALR